MKALRSWWILRLLTSHTGNLEEVGRILICRSEDCGSISVQADLILGMTLQSKVRLPSFDDTYLLHNASL